MRVLIISSYPPDRCGVASYAVQVAATLRREGHAVEVVSPQPSAARHFADYSRTARGVLRALALSRRADRTLVEFFPDLLFRPSGRVALTQRFSFMRRWVTVAALFAFGRQVELVVHEAPYQSLRGRRDPRGRVGRFLWRTLVTLPAATFVHTAWERQELVESTGVDPARIRVLPHGAMFVRHAGSDRASARRELGLSDDHFHFLSIGFLQPHKGFDRAMRARSGIEGAGVRLHVVGSVRVPSRDVVEHVELLRRLAATIPGVELHEGYLSDELFDRWIVACDAVVLPYRDIWSSGVLERAKLYGRPAVVSDVGGLRDQADDSTRVVRDDDELVAAMAELAGVPHLAQSRPEDGEVLSHAGAMELMRMRAAALRERHEPGTVAPEIAGSAGRLAAPPRVALPVAPTGSGLRARVKRLVDRLTRWQLVPLVRQINELRDYVAEQSHPTDPGPVHRRAGDDGAQPDRETAPRDRAARPR